MSDKNHYPNAHTSNPATVLDLVEALNKMRDALMRFSISLHDYQFEFDIERRHSANGLSTKLINKVNASDQPK